MALKKTKTTALPKSKAKTAYGLLSDICRVVTEQPLRLRMAAWITTNPQVMPECGTVCCIAGWASALRPRVKSLKGMEWYDAEVEFLATKILGLTRQQAEELFVPHELVHANNQQTPEHAAAAVAHVREFQKKYSRQLKAKRV